MAGTSGAIKPDRGGHRRPDKAVALGLHSFLQRIDVYDEAVGAQARQQIIHPGEVAA